MRDNFLLDHALPDETKSAVGIVLRSETTNFTKLIRDAGLNPAKHLRRSDLRDVDFSDSDLRGFDFTDCDLRGAHGIRVQWDPQTTILTDAQLDGSIFAHRINMQNALAHDESNLLHRKVRGLSWADQIVWVMKNLRQGVPDLERNRLVGASIFEHTSDSFLKGEVLKYLVRSAQGADQARLHDFVLDIINGYSGDLHLISKAITILSKSAMRGSWRLQAVVEPLLNSKDDRVVALGIQFLASSYDSKAEIKHLANFALSRRKRALRNAFVGSLSRRLGPAYDILARDPTNNDYRDPFKRIDPKEFSLVLRNIRRTFRAEEDAISEGKRKSAGPIMEAYGQAIHDKILTEEVEERYQLFADYGFKWVQRDPVRAQVQAAQ